MPRRQIIRSPFRMKERVNLLSRRNAALFIIGINPTVPTSPNGRRVHIDNIFTEVTAPNSRKPRTVQLMRERMELLHKPSDFLFIEVIEITFPIVLIAETP
ncbi:hypothetical protein D3C77_449790 [compost metagenome]